MTEFEKIHNEIVADPDNAWATEQGWQPLYSAHRNSKILIIGQAPGRLAQERGIPWDDPSGRNLRAWMGIDDDVFYDPARIGILPMDFYFPGSKERGDLPPRPGFADKWHQRLQSEMDDVRLTLLIGQYAQSYYLGAGRKKNLTETVRAFSEYRPALFPLVHPSPRNNIWQKKNPWFQSSLLPKLKAAVKQALQA
jgi:uracil-DNA glycosylase